MELLLFFMFYDAVDNNMSFLHDVLPLGFAQRSQHHVYVLQLILQLCILLILFVGCNTENILRSEDP